MSVAAQIEAAFDYRGFVTVAKRDGSSFVGFLYDRTPAQVELFDEQGATRVAIPVADIASVALSGDDVAAKATAIWARRMGKLQSADASAYGEWDADHRPLVITALPIERTAARAAGLAAVAIGIAGDPAAAIRAHRPSLVISAGFAGGIDPTLRAGDLVVASAVRDGDELLAAPRTPAIGRAGVIAHSRTILATPAEKAAIRGAIAVDMESAAVARAANAAGIPWLVLRAIVDPADVALPAFVRAKHPLLHGLRSPIALARLALAARKASRALERGLAAVRA